MLKDQGATMLHFYMRPGVFTCSLKVTAPDSAVSWAFRQITVTGEAPLAGFELWHGPYYHHIDQYLYAQVPAAVRSTAANRLRITVADRRGFSLTLCDRTGLDSLEQVLLVNADLDSGDYTVQAELLSPANARISVIREFFSKPCDGIPYFGIDRYNNTYKNGVPLFVVWAKLVESGDMAFYQSSGVTNTVNCEEWRTAYSIATWTQYLTSAQNRGLYAVGPHDELWDGHSDPYDVAERHQEENSNTYKLLDYVRTFKNTAQYPQQIMWTWDDEPNMGRQDYRVTPTVVAAWTHLTHTIDAQRPVTNDIYGFDYLTYYDSSRPLHPYIMDAYNYRGSAFFYGGKKYWHSDIIGWDIYPVWSAGSAHFAGKNLFEEYTLAYDRLVAWNYNLVPTFAWVEASYIPGGAPQATAPQIIMEAWIGIVHGAKAVAFFQCKDPAPPYSTMSAITNLVTKVTPALAYPPSVRTITDNANTLYNRVDITTREKDNELWIFAVRVTELAETAAAAINVQFTVPGVENGTVQVYDESRNVTLTGGTFTDSFAPCAVHIYKFTLPTAIIDGPARQDDHCFTLPNPCTVSELHHALPVHASVYDVAGNAVRPALIRQAGIYFILGPDGKTTAKIMVTR
jgi:hypothetical protein